MAVIAAPRKYPDEVPELAIRLVRHLVEGGEKSIAATSVCLAGRQLLDINTDTVRDWIEPALVDAGERPRLSTSERPGWPHRRAWVATYALGCARGKR